MNELKIKIIFRWWVPLYLFALDIFCWTIPAADIDFDVVAEFLARRGITWETE